MASSAAPFSKRVASILKKAPAPSRPPWFSPHMAAARLAILRRIPLVDFAVEVRDARAPISSAFEALERSTAPCRRMILLNKVDLADRCETERWITHFRERNCDCFPVNAHNKESIKGLLNFLRKRTKELKLDNSSTATFLLVGIPNVGKSAIVNALHQTGRISSAEKGKLKYATVTPLPGETKDISSFKIASHPNIYILDTPGVLPPRIPNDPSCANLALIGSISDVLVGELELACYFLAILNSGNKYKQWENLGDALDGRLGKTEVPLKFNSVEKKGRYDIMDHTQDPVVQAVRQALVGIISRFSRKEKNETEMDELIEAQIRALHESFSVQLGTGGDGCIKVAAKLLNLYRTGRLGRHTLEFSQHNPNK